RRLSTTCARIGCGDHPAATSKSRTKGWRGRRRVRHRALGRRQLLTGKLVRAVLRGRGDGNITLLPDHMQRVKSEGRWVVHLRPTAKGKARVKEKLKALTSRRWTWMDEYSRLTTLNAIVRGWANYYRPTSL